MDKPTFRDIVETYCKTERWNSDTDCFITCPGEHKHSTRTKYGDTRVWVQGGDLRLKCFHSSCTEYLYPLYGQLKMAWDIYGNPEPPEVAEARKKVEDARKELRQKFETIGSNLLNTHPWPLKQIREDSPRKPENQISAFLDLFKEGDVIWTGEPQHSGMLHNTINFQEVRRWRSIGPKGRFTCPSTFYPGSRSRALKNITSTPYLIVEADSLVPNTDTVVGKLANKDGCGAIFRFLQEYFGLKLRMIVDSGNKSLQAWFLKPEEKTMEILNTVIPAIGADKAMLNPCQPCRIPGVLREPNGARQELVWYDNKNQN